jgi:hypothetical protein
MVGKRTGWIFVLFLFISLIVLASLASADSCNNNKVVLLGDSITVGWGPKFIQSCGGQPINYAVGGKMTGWMLDKLKSDIIGEGNTHLVVLGGTNDVTSDKSAAQIILNLEQMYFMAKENNIKVIAGTIPPYNRDSKEDFNNIVKEVNYWIKSQKDLGNIDAVVDFYQLLLGNEPCMNSLYASSCNNVHPNPAGYTVMANKVFNEVFGGQITPVTSLSTSAGLQEFTTMVILGRHIRSEMENRVSGGYGIIKQGGNFNKLILTGGCVAANQDATCQTCNGCNEADEMEKYLLTLGSNDLTKLPSGNLAYNDFSGIPREITVIKEGDSKSTADNLKKSKGFIQPGEKVLVVSDHDHVRPFAYCLRYSDPGADAYYYHLKDSSYPEVPSTTLPGTNLDYGKMAAGCSNGITPSQQNIQQSPQYPQQQKPGQQYTTKLVPKNLPSQQREIDESWSVKVGFPVRGSILIWDDTLGNWGWRNYSNVYFSVVSTPVSKGIVMGQGSAGVGSYSTPKYSKGGNEYNDLIKKAAAMYPPVEPELIKAIMVEESSFNPLDISSTGCSGLMQVCLGGGKPHTNIDCKQYRSAGPQLCNGVPDERFNVEKNILAGTKILKGKYNSAIQNCGTDYIKAWTTAYNMGNKFVDDAIKRVGNCNNWETVWQELSKHWDPVAHTYTMQDGEVVYKSWITKSKLDGKSGAPGTYTGDVYALYLGYKAAGLGASASPSGSSATTSSSTAPYQGTYAGQAQVKDPNCLILYGDTRNPTSRQKIAIESIKKECANPSLFHVGDFVDEGESKESWDEFLDYERDLINQGTLYAIVGNHEDRKPYDGKGYQAIADHLGGEFTYILNQMSNGGHHVVPITSNLIAIILNTEGNCNSETQFLKQQLNANPNKGVMLGFHKPAYPHIHTTHGNGCAKEWHQLLVEHKNKGNKVLAFAGDTHGLARVIRDGVTHLEVGAMLNPRSCLSPQGSAFCKQTRGYYRCDANLHCVAKDENGNTLDKFNG